MNSLCGEKIPSQQKPPQLHAATEAFSEYGPRKLMSATIFLIGGCNGVGKTTFAMEFLPKEVKCLRFLNADELSVAQGCGSSRRPREEARSRWRP
jgi:hypothetical protein